MTLRDEIAIRCAPAKVWAAISDPSLMPLWNPKCVTCERQEGLMRRGSRYKATFRMRGPEQETWCEVLDCSPTQLLTTRYSGIAFRNGGYVEETFRLTPLTSGTQLLHAVDFAHAGLPWLVRLLMQLVSAFGESVGKSSLEGIRTLVEEGTATPVDFTVGTRRKVTGNVGIQREVRRMTAGTRIAVIVAMLMGGWTWAWSENTNQTPERIRLDLDLADGSRVMGVPTVTSVPIQTPYAKMDIPLRQIITIEIGEDNEQASIVLRNGDSLKGVINR